MTTTTATKNPSTELPFVVTPQRLSEHELDLERRRKSRLPLAERLRLCDPAYAKKKEDEKPRYKFTVKVCMYTMKKKDNDDGDEDLPGSNVQPVDYETEVIAKTETDAWAIACDRFRKKYQKMPFAERQSHDQAFRGELLREGMATIKRGKQVESLA